MKLTTVTSKSFSFGVITLAWIGGFPNPGEAFNPAPAHVAITRRSPIVVLQSSNGNFEDMMKNNGNFEDMMKNNEFSTPDVSGVSETAKKVLGELGAYDASRVIQNIQEGEVGQRGELYFVAQAALVICILIGGLPVLGEALRWFLVPTLLVGGIASGVMAVVDLGSDCLSPFPMPTREGVLKTNGIYAQMRHPMYTALLSIMLAVSVVTNSADRLLLTAFLYYLLEIKSTKEEALLLESYGDDYLDYMDAVPEKFFPKGLIDVLPWSE